PLPPAPPLRDALPISRSISAPRRVALTPTITAPARAAPPIRYRNSGLFPISTPTCGGFPSGRRARIIPATRAHRSRYSPYVTRRSEEHTSELQSPCNL